MGSSYSLNPRLSKAAIQGVKQIEGRVGVAPSMSGLEGRPTCFKAFGKEDKTRNLNSSRTIAFWPSVRSSIVFAPKLLLHILDIMPE
jgi:hypothetical protein